MPASTEKQRIAAALALKARRGQMDVKKLGRGSLKMYKSKMTNEQLEHFARKA